MLSQAEHQVARAVPVVLHMPHFCTAAEEAALLSCVDSAAASWVQLRGRRLQQLGGMPRPDGMIPEPIPGWMQTVLDALVG